MDLSRSHDPNGDTGGSEYLEDSMLSTSSGAGGHAAVMPVNESLGRSQIQQQQQRRSQRVSKEDILRLSRSVQKNLAREPPPSAASAHPGGLDGSGGGGGGELDDMAEVQLSTSAVGGGAAAAEGARAAAAATGSEFRRRRRTTCGCRTRTRGGLHEGPALTTNTLNNNNNGTAFAFLAENNSAEPEWVLEFVERQQLLVVQFAGW